MQIVNQYSAVMALILPLGLLALAVVGRQRPLLSRLSLIGGLLALIVVGYFLLQTEAKGMAPNQVEALLAGPGRPVFLELYSDY
jgi:4-amino-4-deoxy-L-arabinose transferase-like glycosyltransferase